MTPIILLSEVGSIFSLLDGHVKQSLCKSQVQDYLRSQLCMDQCVPKKQDLASIREFLRVAQDVQSSDLPAETKEIFQKRVACALQREMQGAEMSRMYGWVYATASASVRGVKIGFTLNDDLDKRIRQYNIAVEKVNFFC